MAGRINGLAAFVLALAAIALATLASRGPAYFFESAADARLRDAMVGRWSWQFQDAARGEHVRIALERHADGHWGETITTSSASGEIRDRFSRRGRWFVAGGVLKTHTLYIDDRPIGRNSRLAFQNYPIEAVGPATVRYRIDPANGLPGQWQRVFDRERSAPGLVVVETREG